MSEFIENAVDCAESVINEVADEVAPGFETVSTDGGRWFSNGQMESQESTVNMQSIDPETGELQGYNFGAKVIPDPDNPNAATISVNGSSFAGPDMTGDFAQASVEVEFKPGENPTIEISNPSVDASTPGSDVSGAVDGIAGRVNGCVASPFRFGG